MALPSPARSVITGAGSGFGRALALALASRGGHLVLGDIDEQGLSQTAEEARSAGAASVTALRCDVTRIADVESLASACAGRIDLVVNNAGVSSGGAVGELPLDVWRATIEVNLFGVINGCHVFVPVLRRQGAGHVLNVASAAAFASLPYMGAYNVAKAGVVSLSETLAGELVGTGVGVTVLCPTFFRTNIVVNGHFASPDLKQRGQDMVDRGTTVEHVVRLALRAVERGDLYSLPMMDARWMWRVKRTAPALWLKMVAKVARRLAPKGAGS